MTDSRRTFGPVAVLGLAAAAGAAVAGAKTWAEPGKPPADVGLIAAQALEADMPLAGALALVLLAGWGVMLVTRGSVRRVASYLLVLVAAGLLAATAAAFWTLDASLEEEFDALQTGVPYSEVGTSMTGWYWLAAVSALLALVTTVAAARWVRTWPEMASRYDAPGTGAPTQPQTSTDLWKALDEGRDPTDPPQPGAPSSP